MKSLRLLALYVFLRSSASAAQHSRQKYKSPSTSASSRLAPTATTITRPMDAHRLATTVPHGLPEESSSEPVPGSTALSVSAATSIAPTIRASAITAHSPVRGEHADWGRHRGWERQFPRLASTAKNSATTTAITTASTRTTTTTAKATAWHDDHGHGHGHGHDHDDHGHGHGRS